MSTIGKKLRQLRGERSGQEVADALGVGVSTIYMYENDHRIPNDSMKVAIAKYYNKTVQEIFFDNIGHE